MIISRCKTALKLHKKLLKQFSHEITSKEDQESL